MDSKKLTPELLTDLFEYLLSRDKPVIDINVQFCPACHSRARCCPEVKKVEKKKAGRPPKIIDPEKAMLELERRRQKQRDRYYRLKKGETTRGIQNVDVSAIVDEIKEDLQPKTEIETKPDPLLENK